MLLFILIILYWFVMPGGSLNAQVLTGRKSTVEDFSDPSWTRNVLFDWMMIKHMLFPSTKCLLTFTIIILHYYLSIMTAFLSTTFAPSKLLCCLLFITFNSRRCCGSLRCWPSINRLLTANISTLWARLIPSDTTGLVKTVNGVYS